MGKKNRNKLPIQTTGTADHIITQKEIPQERKLNGIQQTHVSDIIQTKEQEKEVNIQRNEKTKPKPRKTVSTKTFAHGLMDVSLLTSNATQLRCVLANPLHDFYTFLVCLISLSIVLQIISGFILVIADYFKSSEGEKDEVTSAFRKKLNFVSLAIVSNITAINILISAFYSPYSPTVKS